MLFISKHNNAPSSDSLSTFLMRASRSLRSRSKLTRSSQSTPIRPYVLIAIVLLLYWKSQGGGKQARPPAPGRRQAHAPTNLLVHYWKSQGGGKLTPLLT